MEQGGDKCAGYEATSQIMRERKRKAESVAEGE